MMGGAMLDPGPLTAPELSRLAELEAVVSKGLRTFWDVGNALLEIRNSGLYRGPVDENGKCVYKTFEQYCHIRWGMSRRHADEIIASTAVLDNLSAMALKPENERQVRPLASLPAEEQKAAWKEAVETAPDHKPTARHVKEVIERRKGNSAPVKVNDIEMTDDFRRAYDGLVCVIGEEKRHKWERMTREAATRHVRDLFDLIQR